MPIKWRPGEIRWSVKYCDHPNCKLEMYRDPTREVAGRVGKDFPVVYEYRCADGHVASDKLEYPRWYVADCPPAKKKPVAPE